MAKRPGAPSLQEGDRRTLFSGKDNHFSQISHSSGDKKRCVVKHILFSVKKFGHTTLNPKKLLNLQSHKICRDMMRPIRSLPARIWTFYYDGFRSMTVGKTLWAIILIKLFIFFVVIKMLFFPNLLQRDFDSDEERADHVRQELISR